MAADVPDPFLDDDDEPLSARLTSASPTLARHPVPLAQPRVVKGLRAPSLFLPIPSVRLASKPSAFSR
jgi:hypothetical protein